MRVGKNSNVAEFKKTRSCVVRLEKVSKNNPNVSLSPEDCYNIRRTVRSSTTDMGSTTKGRRGGITSQQEDNRANTSNSRKKVIGVNISAHSNIQTPQQQRALSSSMSNIRSTQKVKIIPRSNKTTPASTPSREESPPPTIAAGRSRRAIKPNPKYASEDMVTPKVVRNVGMLASSSRGGASGQSRTRKASSSSDDFYNRNSEDDYENDVNDTANDDDDNDDYFQQNDKAYEESEKDENDSDFSVVEETVRLSRARKRPKKSQAPIQTSTQQISNKLLTLPANTKRSSTISANTSNLRSAPSQLQQIRRSLASSNAQRNLNLIEGNSGTAPKRRREDIEVYSDSESSYSTNRKQLLLSNSSGLKVKVPVRENRIGVNSTSIIRSRLSTQPQVYKIQQQTVNGSNKINNTQTVVRRTIEIAPKSNSEAFAKNSLRQSATAANMNTNNKVQTSNSIAQQPKVFAAKTLRFRSGSPKLPVQKERQNNGAAIPISSSSSSSSSINSKKQIERTKTLSSQSATKSKTTSHNSFDVHSEDVHEIKDDSPNSTMDDFETMPTFTIVNVNDIMNKKGDVLLTKTKLNSNKNPTVIEFSESISLDDEDDDDNDNDNDNDEVEEVAVFSTPARPQQILSKISEKLPTVNNRKDIESKKSIPTRSNESYNQAPQILNHKLVLRNSRVTAKTTLVSSDKPAPRILNSMVAKKTEPVKPLIANMDDSADESFPLSLDEDEEEDGEQQSEYEIESQNKNRSNMTAKPRRREYQNLIEVDTEDTESHNTEDDEAVLQRTNTDKHSASKVAALTPKQSTGPERRRRTAGIPNTPYIVSSNKKRMTPAAAKENSLAATNQQVNDITSTTTKQPIASTLPSRKSNSEKVVISKQGDKIIKKITCFETWYVINMPIELKRPTVMKNQLEMPLIHLANLAKKICLPNNLWSSKVNLYELTPQTLVKGTFVTYTGDLYEHKISEEDRGKYQPSCVMFRRSFEKNPVSRMPYDRAVVFKNKTFYTNIEGKNVRLVGAPSIINSESEIEILLEVVDSLTLQSEFVEHISLVQ